MSMPLPAPITAAPSMMAAPAVFPFPGLRFLSILRPGSSGLPFSAPCRGLTDLPFLRPGSGSSELPLSVP